MIKFLIAFFSLGILGGMPAIASAGTVQCLFYDHTADFLFDASFDDNGKTGLLNVNGHLSAQSIQSRDPWPSLSIQANNIDKQKFDRDVAYLGLRFLPSDALASSVTLKVAAKRVAADWPAYSGDYVLTITPAVEAAHVVYTGMASCTVK